MDLSKVDSVYLIGIGGIGMSALARYFKHQGAFVAGYDRTRTDLTDQLTQEGIVVHYDEDPNSIPAPAVNDGVLVIRTPAVPTASPIYGSWQDRGITVYKRSEVLGMITREHRSVAVAGTHGKTTVSTMLAHLLKQGGVGVNAFMGGISANYGTNVLFAENAEATVIEADEYDRSFLQLHPQETIITSLDADHLDIYGDVQQMYDAYAEFAERATELLLVRKGLAEKMKSTGNVVEYAIDAPADVHASNVSITDGTYNFSLSHSGKQIDDLKLGMPGRHNVENALAASYMALHIGLSEEQLRDGLASFKGVARRFDVHLNTAEVALVDDYAHHPAEIEACLGSVKELFPGRKVTAIFQPHLFSRTRDFASDFATSLAKADEVILLDIYPAREQPIEGITSQWLAAQVNNTPCEVIAKDDVISAVEKRDNDVVVMMGAGDISTLVGPMKEMLAS